MSVSSRRHRRVYCVICRVLPAYAHLYFCADMSFTAPGLTNYSSGPKAKQQHKHITMDSLRGASVNIGTIQIILARPLRKDDTHTSRSVNNTHTLQTVLTFHAVVLVNRARRARPRIPWSRLRRRLLLWLICFSNDHMHLRPISLLRLSLLRLVDSKLPGSPLWT